MSRHKGRGPVARHRAAINRQAALRHHRGMGEGVAIHGGNIGWRAAGGGMHRFRRDTPRDLVQGHAGSRERCGAGMGQYKPQRRGMVHLLAEVVDAHAGMTPALRPVAVRAGGRVSAGPADWHWWPAPAPEWIWRRVCR